MIYPNGIKVNKIVLDVEDDVTCHLHLSNGKVFTRKPNELNPSIIHNKIKLENFSVYTIAKALDELKGVMEND